MNNEYLYQNSLLALEVFPEAIILVDKNHVIQLINSAALRLFKISDAATILGTSFSTFPGGSGLMTYSQRVTYHNHVNELATHKILSPQPYDEQQWSIDINNRIFNFRATPMRDEHNQDRGFIISVHEWTGERKASELLISLISELLMPLHAIRGYSELLLKENSSSPLTKEQREWVTKINENAKKLLEFRETTITDINKQNEGKR